MKKAVSGFLCLVIAFFLLFTDISTCRAAGFNVQQTGLQTATGYHYIIDDSKLVLWENNVTIPDDVPFQCVDFWEGDRFVYYPMHTSKFSSQLFLAADLDPGSHSFSNTGIVVRFPQAAYGYDGQYHDVTMTIGGITIKVYDKATSGSCIMGNAWDTDMDSGTGPGYFRLRSTREDGPNGNIAVRMNLTIKVDDAKAGEKVFVAFQDIDAKGDTDDHTGWMNNFQEGIEPLSGVIDNTVYLHEDSLIKINGNQFCGTKATSGADQLKAGLSYLANAQGFSFKWSGYKNCATGIGLDPDGFNNVSAKTQISHMDTSGNYPAFTDMAGSGQRWLYGMYYHYWWSWTTDRDPAYNSTIYDVPNPVTVGENNLLWTDSSNPKIYQIWVPRKQYEYSFNFNVPPGRNLSEVGNQQGNFKRYAESLSDASPKSPTLAGWDFKGWNTNAAGTGSGYPGAESMLSNKTFYAKWEHAKYKVHFNANGASNPNHETGEFTQNTTTGTMADQEMQFDVASNLTGNVYARAGYTFAGWNTKADGTGTAYSNGQSVTNLITYDKTEITLYAQWTKQLGTETITVVSEETGNRVDGVSMKLQKNVNGTWTDYTTGTTNSNGQITVNNLHWFNWRWVMTGVPAGYVRSADTGFTINYNQLSATNQVILYMKRVTIILDSQVSDIIKGENAPAFLYHISGTDVAGIAHEYDLLVQTNTSSKFGSNRLSNLFAGTYAITQTPVSRYNPITAVNISNGTANGINASVNVKDYDSAEIRFPYTIKEYGWYYGVNSRINKLPR